MKLTKRPFWLTAIVFMLGVFSSSVRAQSVSDELQAELTAKLTANFPQVKVESIASTVFEGLYELELDSGEIIFMNPAGDHLIVNARVLHVQGRGQVVDLIEQKKAQSRRNMLANLDLSKAVTFKGDRSKGKTTALYVFTDVDCGYCRKLHEEVPELQAAGVDVHYFAWPRAGLQSQTAEKMHQVWCAEDQQSAMTLVKSSGPLKDAIENCESPLAEHLKVGVKLGVKGTPAIFLESGDQVGGYAAASELLNAINAVPAER